MNFVVAVLAALAAFASYFMYKAARHWIAGGFRMNTEVMRKYGIQAGVLLLLMFASAFVLIDDGQPLTWQKVITLVVAFGSLVAAAGLGRERRAWVASEHDSSASS